MNIVLIGMRGSGKTTVGKRLARRLGRKFIEMDDLVAKKAGMPIADIVRQLGWDHFRDLESEVAEEVGRKNNAVISAGGGVVERAENIENLKRNGKTVLLTGTVKTLLLRIGHSSKRPFLTEAKTMREDIETVSQQREKRYRDGADIIIDTENKPVNTVVKEVLQRINLDQG